MQYGMKAKYEHYSKEEFEEKKKKQCEQCTVKYLTAYYMNDKNKNVSVMV